MTNPVWSTYPQMRSILRSIFPWSNFNRNGWSILNRYQQFRALQILILLRTCFKSCNALYFSGYIRSRRIAKNLF